MIAKLMELANTLFRYRGTAVADSPEWDETIRLLLLMLAPAAPHITEELWSRRLAAAGAAVGRRSTPQTWPEVDPTRRRRVDPRDPGPGQRQAARQGGRRRRRHDRRHRGRGPGPREDPGDPRRPGAGPDRRGRRRQAGQPRRPVTLRSDAARLRSPSRRDRARRRGHRSGAPRHGPRRLMPDAVETFDAERRPPRDRDAAGRCATSCSRSSRTSRGSTSSWRDGADLPNPDGRIEGTGKRIRHVKVRSVEDAGAPWLRAAIEAQLAR